jgi:hypothetical protein
VPLSTKILVFVLTCAGLVVSMLTPLMALGLVMVMLWGPELLHRSLGASHPSTIFFLCLVPPAMLAFAVVFVALVLLPVFAKYGIPLTDTRVGANVFSRMARWTQKRAITYARLMDKYRA